MQLNKFTIGKKSMDYSALINFKTPDGNDAQENRNVNAYEEPLPSLLKAFSVLPAVMAALWNVSDPDYADRIKVHGITISHTKAGTRSVILRGKIQLDSRTNYLHPMESPMVQIDDNGEGESGEVQISDQKHLKAIKKAIHECEGYAYGTKRSQKLLDFSESKAALQATADQGQEQLGFGS